MTLSDLLPNASQLNALQGVERDLMLKRRNSRIGALVSIVAIIVQVVAAAEGDWLGNAGQFVANLFTGNWDQLFGKQGLDIYEVLGLSIVAAGFLAYTGYGYLAFFFKDSEEPFRYTFWIEKIEILSESVIDDENTPALKDLNRLELLHYDVKERLNLRIKRLSLLAPADAKKKSTDGENRSPSNIRISGQCALRNDDEGLWLHIMPTVRIGPSGTSETLAQPIKFKPSRKDELTASDYGLIVEQVYSSIATEIYRQIKIDIEQKIKLYPFGYLRAVALVNEAMDFERSNTIDAYDHAIDLYRRAIRYHGRNKVRLFSRWIACWPIIWRKEVATVHREARTFTGYARCLIYRRTISALSGLSVQSTLYEIPSFIEQQIDALERISRHIRSDSLNETEPGDAKGSHSSDFIKFLTYPKDNWLRLILLRPQERLFKAQRQLRAEAHIVSALTCNYLNDIDGARDNLRRAREIAPVISQDSALYYLAAGEIETEINKKLLHLQKATELDPYFEIALYQLAFYEDMRLRMEGDLSNFRIKSVISKYKQVATINPGNISSQLNCGYLYWLLTELDSAKNIYREGREKKSLVAATFTGDLVYGLARIATEQGNLELGLELYTQAFAADPSIATYTAETAIRSTSAHFAYMNSAILRRYREFLDTASKYIEAKRADSADEEKLSATTLDALLGYVLNDFGSANLNYYHRHGDKRQLKEAINAFERARYLNPGHPVVNYNLYNAYSWTEDYPTAVRRLMQAQELAAAWPKVAIELAQSSVREKLGSLERARGECDATEARLRELETELRDKKQQATERKMTLHRVVASATTLPRIDSIRHPLTVSIGSEANKTLRTQITKLEQEIVEANSHITRLRTESKRNKSQRLRAEDALNLSIESAVDTIVANSMLAPMFRGHEESPADKIRRLLKQSDLIDWTKLDLDDFDALVALASVLQYTDWKTALGLCRHLQATYRQLNNFDLAAVIHEIEQGHAEETHSADTSKLKQTLHLALESEPVYFVALVWYVRSFEPLTIKDAYGQLPTDYNQKWDVYHCLMGHVYQHLGSDWSFLPEREKVEPLFQRAIEELRKPLLANPDNAEYHGYIAEVYSKHADYLDTDRIRDVKAAATLRLSAMTHYRKAMELDKRIPYYASNLGAVCEMLGRNEEAERHYKRAVRADKQNAEFHYRLARIQSKLDKNRSAENSFRKACELAPWIAHYHTELANHLDDPDAIESAMHMAIRLDPGHYLYYNKLGNMLYGTGAYERSVNWYEAAIHRQPNDEILRSNLAGACESIVEKIISGQETDSSIQTPEARSRAIGYVDKAIEALQRAAEIQSQDEPYRQRLDELKKSRRLLSVYTPNVFKRIPVVTPIAIEVAANLVPMVETPGNDSLHPELAKLIEKMRQRLLDHYGVRMPSVRFRSNDDLADGTYVMMLSEVPLQSGRIDITQRFSPNPPEALAQLGLKDTFTEESSPLPRAPGTWHPDSNWHAIEEAGLALWSIIEYPIRHLEALLESNLPDFMGIQEIVNTLEEHQINRLDDIMAAAGGLPALCGVIRALLTERVPITEIAVICDVFLAERSQGTSLVGIVEKLRREPSINPQVPGTHDDSKLYRVDNDFSNAVKNALNGSGSTRVLALEPELCQELLTAVRTQVEIEEPTSLLLGDTETRPYLSKLIQLEFPDLPVVTQAEMPAGYDNRIAGTITLFDDGGATP